MAVTYYTISTLWICNVFIVLVPDIFRLKWKGTILTNPIAFYIMALFTAVKCLYIWPWWSWLQFLVSLTAPAVSHCLQKEIHTLDKTVRTTHSDNLFLLELELVGTCCSWWCLVIMLILQHCQGRLPASILTKVFLWEAFSVYSNVGG
jgi:hypothetical protein